MQRTGLLLLLFTTLFARGQQPDTAATVTLFEKIPTGLVRFYFDDYYYLVDKDCVFKSIERVSQFIVEKNVFHADFRDFDQNGTVVLRGYHNQGIKEGPFKAYHPNGTLKWEVTFEQDRPIGDWKYYYPDGKPMLTVNYDEAAVRIMAFWDRRGRQRIKDGNGSYEFTMPFAFYNEYGYPFFERKGKVRNGLPRGYWTTHMVDHDGKKTLYTEEVFDDNTGILSEGYNLFLDATYRTPMAFVPISYFYTAERLLSKPCSFDDYSGFNTYLSEKFSAMLRSSPTLTNIEDKFSYEIQLDKEGNPTEVTLKDALATKELNRYLEMVLNEIPFYFPTLDQDGNAIAGTVTVHGSLSVNDAGQFHFHSFHIIREKQP
ncbi:toxin-antitoxin system YwqK family antitoxin [Sphingobacterium gobiense]|uniref:MORN repeat variant n=1 Tax=Sphingobacterium gobiense TaxID=1382456 RepID=A0A2S9JG10_9SPHI|nr:hypothetical protein [Sphingobacterium gobiense]PRD51886.1 hypothetical protein C5749_16415 [Sphingobacterium gobiense]